MSILSRYHISKWSANWSSVTDVCKNNLLLTPPLSAVGMTLPITLCKNNLLLTLPLFTFGMSLPITLCECLQASTEGILLKANFTMRAGSFRTAASSKGTLKYIYILIIL